MIRYFPLTKPLYEVVPGLGSLGGPAPHDALIFQIDEDFAKARQNKIACRYENLEKYFLQENLPSECKLALVRFLISRLPREYPHFFKVQTDANGDTHLQCSHTGDSFGINSHGELISFSSSTLIEPAVRDAVDAFALQVQEDLALLVRREEKEHLALLHLCSPSHWSGKDKIGKSFFDIHAPVPGIELVNRAAKNIVNVMISKGPFVRFVWSFVTDSRLNHHPEAPPGIDPVSWKGRAFDAANQPPFYLRVERQTTFGFPDQDCALFTIRVSFWGGDEIKGDSSKKNLLAGALESMGPESRVYKGVAHCFDELIQWLKS